MGLPQVSYLENLKFQNWAQHLLTKETDRKLPTSQAGNLLLVTVLLQPSNLDIMNVKGIVRPTTKRLKSWGFDNITVDEENLGLKVSYKMDKAFAKGIKGAGESMRWIQKNSRMILEN